MPITYHYRSQSPESADDLPTFPLSPLADDSIVLSDLIRTGETSRLRRRGAMRLEHNGSSSTRHNRRRSSTQRIGDDATYADPLGHRWTVVESPSRRSPRHLPMFEVSEADYDLEDSDSDSGDEMVFSASFNRAISEQTGRQRQDDSGSTLRGSVELEGGEASHEKLTAPYTLVCGAPIDDMAICARSDPESVYSALASFILPQPPPSDSSSPRRTPSAFNSSNGCGSVIHTHASPRHYHRQPMWAASTPATDAVVPLEAMYFDDVCAREKLSTKMMKLESCGCLRIGIGCANCGNPLGFQLTPCNGLKDHILLRQSRSHHRVPRTPSKFNSGEQFLHLYTFFCSSTSSPQAAKFPTIDSAVHRRRDRLRARDFADAPLLPPPPLIRLLSDSELSDSDDEEVVIDFRPSGHSMTGPRILGGDITSSPEPQAIHLEPNPTPGRDFNRNGSPLQGSTFNLGTGTHPLEVEEDSELGQARASWANVIRGVEAAASSMGEVSGRMNDSSSGPVRNRRPRGPERRGALGFDAEEELGLTRLPNSSRTREESLNLNPYQRDIPSILLDEAALVLTPPPPQPHELVPSTLETTDAGADTPRQTIWGMSFADGLPSTSFWGRPAEGTEWTWTNELGGYAESERGGAREISSRRVFDPDGEFLEGLDGEWGEEMARELGFSSVEEKSEGNEVSTGTGERWWPEW